MGSISIGIGKKADFVILENLENFKNHSVFAGCEPIRTNTDNSFNYPEYVYNTTKYKEIVTKDLQLTYTLETVIPIRALKFFQIELLPK